MNRLDNRKGISLIVLVITIIVMIILAMTIILSLQSSGIIGRANEAKISSDIANKKQAATVALAEYELAMQSGEIDEGVTATSYVQNKLGDQGIEYENVFVDENNNIIVGSGASAINKDVAIGEYVNYTPDMVTNKTYKVYDLVNKTITNTNFQTQTGNNALKWRYMGIDEKGNALLVSDSVTKDGIFLQGKDAYVNGPSKLNDLCKSLYTNKDLGEARSINIEDINKILGANPIGKYYSSKESKWVENPKELTIGDILSQKGEPALKTTEVPEEGKSINDYVSDWYTYVGTEYKEENCIEYNLIFKNITIENGVETKRNISYWLASTNVAATFNNGTVYFNLRLVDDEQVYGCSLFYSTGSPAGFGYAVRPVIVLNENVKFDKQNGSEIWHISVK